MDLGGMNKEWEYAGLLIDSFNIDVKRVVADARFGDSYPGQWVAHMEKERMGKPSFVVSAWGNTACDAVINVYNKSHHATPVNQYEGVKVYMTQEDTVWYLRHYSPNTKQHGKVFDTYKTSESAYGAIKHYGLVLS